MCEAGHDILVHNSAPVAIVGGDALFRHPRPCKLCAQGFPRIVQYESLLQVWVLHDHRLPVRSHDNTLVEGGPTAKGKKREIHIVVIKSVRFHLAIKRRQEQVGP